MFQRPNFIFDSPHTHKLKHTYDLQSQPPRCCPCQRHIMVQLRGPAAHPCRCRSSLCLYLKLPAQAIGTGIWISDLQIGYQNQTVINTTVSKLNMSHSTSKWYCWVEHIRNLGLQAGWISPSNTFVRSKPERLDMFIATKKPSSLILFLAQMEHFGVPIFLGTCVKPIVMVKGIPRKVKQASAQMPYRAEKDEPKVMPTSWKQKQRVMVAAGLRAMKAPLVRRSKSLVPQVQTTSVYGQTNKQFSPS